jgi:hypothetical protein
MMSLTLAEKRVNDFERKFGEHGKVALQFAYHAALPVALNADLLHLLRINFFLDPPSALPYTAEFELLLSPLCREIDEGLYEIEPEIRDILLQGLYSIDRGQRIKDVATLLWQYIDRDAVWIDRVELERSQQLTVLNFLDPEKAEKWLSEVEAGISSGQSATRDWYVAMRQDLERQFQPQQGEEELEQDDQRHELQLRGEDFLDELNLKSKPYFSILRTTITDIQILKGALQELGIPVKVGIDVRGSFGIEKKIRADIVAVLEGECDLGWSKNPDGFFDLIVDLWGIAKKHNRAELINSIHQKYAELQERKDDYRQSITDESPRVFISYSHDSQAYIDRVLEIADRLRLDGIDANIDQYEESPPEGWQRWMLNQAEESDFVLIACTEEYDLRFRGKDKIGKGKDSTWEGGVIIQELYDTQGQNSKFIPIIFNPEDANFIPSPLRSTTSYRLQNDDGYELLYRRLTNQPQNRKPQLGKLQTLAPHERKQDFSGSSSFQVAKITNEAQELLVTAFESSDKVIFVVETNMYTHIIAGRLNFVEHPELLATYQYAIAQLVEKGFITKMEPTNCDRYELTSKGYEFCIEAAKSPTDLNTMPVSKTSTVGKSAPAEKTTRSKKQPDAAKLRKIQENIAILRNSRSTDLEKISALKALGRAIDNEQAIQAILFLTRTNKNNDVITEAVKSLGNIGKKDTSILQEMLRLLRSSSNNLVIIEILASLGKIGNTDSTTVRAVLNLLTFNKNGSVIINIMKTFALIAKGNNEVIQKTLSLLPIENDTNVRKSIIETLGEIASGNKSAISQLISTLSLSRDLSNLKQAAANSLGAIAVGDREVISAMERRLSIEQNKSVTDRISVNLNKIDPGNKAAAAYRLKMKKTRSTKK